MGEAGWVSLAFHSRLLPCSRISAERAAETRGASESTLGKPDSPSGIHPWPASLPQALSSLEGPPWGKQGQASPPAGRANPPGASPQDPVAPFRL